MMNRTISAILAVCLLLALGSCRAGDLADGPDRPAQAPTGAAEPTPAPLPEPSPEPPEEAPPWKVAIFTSIANNEPEYVAALSAAERYEGRIALKSIDFYSYVNNVEPPEDETVLSELLQLVEDPEIGALIFIDAGNLDDPIALLKGIMEARPGISYTYINCWPDLYYSYRTDDALMEKVDIALSIDLVETAKKAVNQANELGAEMCVDYTYWYGDLYSYEFLDEDTPRVLPEVRDAIREECEKLGMGHLVSPWGSPFGLFNWPGNDIFDKLHIYGTNICLFSNRCMYQFAIDRGVFGYGEMIVQLCHPGLFHANYSQNVGYPLAQIKDDENHFGDLEWTFEKAKAIVEERDYSGHFATWRVPFSMAATTAAVEYAVGYLDGAIESRCDYAAMKGCFARAMEAYNAGDIGFELNIDPRYGNHFMFTQEYIVL